MSEQLSQQTAVSDEFGQWMFDLNSALCIPETRCLTSSTRSHHVQLLLESLPKQSKTIQSLIFHGGETITLLRPRRFVADNIFGMTCANERLLNDLFHAAFFGMICPSQRFGTVLVYAGFLEPGVPDIDGVTYSLTYLLTYLVTCLVT